MHRKIGTDRHDRFMVADGRETGAATGCGERQAAWGKATDASKLQPPAPTLSSLAPRLELPAPDEHPNGSPQISAIAPGRFKSRIVASNQASHKASCLEQENTLVADLKTSVELLVCRAYTGKQQAKPDISPSVLYSTSILRTFILVSNQPSGQPANTLGCPNRRAHQHPSAHLKHPR